jgi:MFS transporter, DHA1 family, inner membrane transport protein
MSKNSDSQIAKSKNNDEQGGNLKKTQIPNLSFTKPEKLILLILAFLQFSHIVDFMILMPLGPQLMRVFAIDPHQFGLLVSSYTFAAGTTGIATAFFIDRFDRKNALLCFYAGFILGTASCAMAGNYSSLLIARTVTGAFGGVLGSLVFSIVGDAVAVERRASGMGTVMAAFAVASVAGVPFSLYLANHFDWHAPFWFLACISLPIAALIFFKMAPMRAHIESRLERQKPWVPVLEALTDRNKLTALFFMVLLVFGQFTVIPFLSPSMVANAGLTEAQLPLIYLVGGICSMFSGPIMGRLADRYGKKRIFYFGAGLSLVPIFLITHLGRTPVPLVLLIVAIFFIAMGGRMIPAIALVTSTSLPRTRGMFMSLVSSVQQFSSSFASLLSGWIVTRSADGRLMGFETVGYIALGSSLLAIVLIGFIKPVEVSKN